MGSGRGLVEAEAGFFGEGEDALRNDAVLALAALHVVAAIFDAGLELGKPIALAGHRGNSFGRDAFG